jgi:hypothetical protein
MLSDNLVYPRRHQVMERTIFSMGGDTSKMGQDLDLSSTFQTDCGS